MVYRIEGLREVDEDDVGRLTVIDFSKAFDSVNHHLLHKKLVSIGIHPTLVTWIKGFLADRSFQVSVNVALSPIASAHSGVPQGSVLGPLLFLIFMNDIPSIVSSYCLLFADDVKLIAPRSQWQRIQEDLQAFWRWSSSWDLPINASKCVHLPIGRPSPLSLSFNPGIAGLDIPTSTSARDLGTQINTTFTPSAQCRAAANKARGMAKLIRRSFVDITPSMFKPLYSALVRPNLEYAVQTWHPYMVKDIVLLEKVQRMSTRMVKGLSNLPYEARLSALNLFPLERRRRRGDLILCYCILTGKLDVPADLFFLPSRRAGLRREGFRLLQPVAHLDRRKFAFSSRVVTSWNRLPENVVNAASVDDFKKKLDACWDSIF
jgi:hypothetical protein